MAYVLAAALLWHINTATAWASPTPAPIPDIEDVQYPTEEATEEKQAQVPLVLKIDKSGSGCILQGPDKRTVSAQAGDLVFRNWILLSIDSDYVVMERQWARWGLLIFANPQGEIVRLRKPLGLLENISPNFYNLTAVESDYFARAATDPRDYIGQHILNDSSFREASYLKAAKFLPPIADYVVIGDVTAPVKAVVTMNGKIKRTDGGNNEPLPPADPSLEDVPIPSQEAYSDAPGGMTVFDASKHLGLSGTSCAKMQSGVLGGHLRIAAIGCFGPILQKGFEMLALGPLAHDNDTVIIRLRAYKPDSPSNASHSYFEVSLGQKRCVGAPCPATSASFYGAVLQHAQQWEKVFQPAMKLKLPYEERRQLDMAKGVIVASSTVWIGDLPNYGTGADYWLSSPPAKAMQDTSGVPDSLPLTSLALDTALLKFGLFDSALSKIGFYFDTFIFPNGTIDMGHWKDPWKDGGNGQYNCTYPDGLTDMGQMVELFVDAVRYTQDIVWMTQHLGAVLRVGEYLLRARAQALAGFKIGDPRRGLIQGPAEHDTCDSHGMVGGQYLDSYFSVSMWSWRGMVELGRLLQDFPHVHSNGSFAQELLKEAGTFKSDILAALRQSTVYAEDGSPFFVPAAVSQAGIKPTPYQSMTNDTLASYSNFRYYSEMLSAGIMDEATATALMDFRENHGGCLSGMTRYSDHLDDMPAIGYALGSIEHDRIEQYLLLLYGHAANYQGRGSFFSTEQMSLYQENGSNYWRASLGEIQADFCTPSQMLIATMTAMQVVFEERDSLTIWLARAAPRRWYAKGAGFGVEDAPSRYGMVSFQVSPQANGTVSARVTAKFYSPGVTLKIRLRDANGQQLSSAAATGDCSLKGIVPQKDLVVLVGNTWEVTRLMDCEVTGRFGEISSIQI